MGERAGGAERGLTLIELLVTLVIVATAIAAQQYSASRANRLAVETNHLRVAKMLLRKKAEEVYAGIETGSGGGFEGYPEAFSWSVTEQLVPLDPGGETPQAEVRLVVVEVRYPSLAAARAQAQGLADEGVAEEGGDGPGRIRVTMLLDPPEAQAPGAGR